jgi:hypothetical protein
MVVLNILSRTSSSNPHRRCRRVQLHLITNTHTDKLHSVGLLWTRDRLVAETSIWQDATLTSDRHPTPRRNSEFLLTGKCSHCHRHTCPQRDSEFLLTGKCSHCDRHLTSLTSVLRPECASVTYPVRLNTDRKLTYQKVNALFRS